MVKEDSRQCFVAEIVFWGPCLVRRRCSNNEEGENQSWHGDCDLFRFTGRFVSFRFEAGKSLLVKGHAYRLIKVESASFLRGDYKNNPEMGESVPESSS